MGTGASWSSRGWTRWLFLVLALLAGCATGPPYLDQALLAQKGQATRIEGVADSYTAGCPDVLDLVVANQADLTSRQPIGPDGCLDLGTSGRLRVEGLTVREIARRMAQQLGVPETQVRVQIAEYNSQQLYVIGQVAGLQRSVPYQGQETVLDLLQRVGGITPGAAPDSVYVVRARIAEGRRPEVFHVDLRAIVWRHDPSTNVRLRPGDQIFVGETRQSCLEKCFPPWLRPMYQAVCGLRRSQGARGRDPYPVPSTEYSVLSTHYSNPHPPTPDF